MFLLFRSPGSQTPSNLFRMAKGEHDHICFFIMSSQVASTSLRSLSIDTSNLQPFPSQYPHGSLGQFSLFLRTEGPSSQLSWYSRLQFQDFRASWHPDKNLWESQSGLSSLSQAGQHLPEAFGDYFLFHRKIRVQTFILWSFGWVRWAFVCQFEDGTQNVSCWAAT